MPTPEKAIVAVRVRDFTWTESVGGAEMVRNAYRIEYRLKAEKRWRPIPIVSVAGKPPDL